MKVGKKALFRKHVVARDSNSVIGNTRASARVSAWQKALHRGSCTPCAPFKPDEGTRILWMVWHETLGGIAATQIIPLSVVLDIEHIMDRSVGAVFKLLTV